MVTKLFSWFRGFFSSFGEESLSKPQQLVERARAHDQVAIATICEVRENAKRGNAKAKETLEEIISYSKSNPVGGGFHGNTDTHQLREACFGADPEQVGPRLLKVAANNPNKAIVTLANSCNAKQMGEMIGDCLEDPAFYAAFKNPKIALQWMKKMNHDGQHALLLGYVLGLATRLQMVRNPRVPLSIYSQRVAWELD